MKHDTKTKNTDSGISRSWKKGQILKLLVRHITSFISEGLVEIETHSPNGTHTTTDTGILSIESHQPTRSGAPSGRCFCLYNHLLRPPLGFAPPLPYEAAGGGASPHSMRHQLLPHRSPLYHHFQVIHPLAMCPPCSMEQRGRQSLARDRAGARVFIDWVH